MLAKTRKRIEALENKVGIDDHKSGWSLEVRLTKLERHMCLLAQHLGVEFSYALEHPIIREVKKP